MRYFEKANARDETSEDLKIEGNWKGFPVNFTTGVDATATGLVAPFEGQLWFFSGSQYLRYDPARDKITVPVRPIADGWNGMPDSFSQGVDAAIHGLGAHLGKIWFFRGSEYVRYSLPKDAVEFGPAPIVENWHGWPEAFADGIDFAFYGTGVHAEHIFFFRGDEFIRYNLPLDRVEEGPSKLADLYPVMGRFMPVPQLFLTEEYTLTTFHGEIGNGGVIGTPTQVGGHTKTEFQVVTKKRVSESDATSSNILESSSERVADNFSKAVREDESSSEAQENYDYGMDASFHGEAHATSLFGGEVDATLRVKGESQDVRRGFAKAVGTQSHKEAARTHDEHREQVSVRDASQQIDVSTETGFKQTVDNSDNPDPINFVLFQLTQEYILVLSLVDANLVFRNGDERAARSVPIREMRSLLDSCVTDTAVREAAAKAVVTALTSVVDHAGATRSLLAAGSTSTAAFVDPSLSTSFPLINSEGKVVRQIVVPGIVIDVDRPVVLTPNTALATLHGTG
ncbi:hemopexin repeat-containing protein [Kribbella sp. NPDC026611]|uniref:hemopexin repeat-containing protein n=1 Tax=Kribbella sp. NPDC026611 TaxID=3154911 RepID=UPI0033D48510